MELYTVHTPTWPLRGPWCLFGAPRPVCTPPQCGGTLRQLPCEHVRTRTRGPALRGVGARREDPARWTQWFYLGKQCVHPERKHEYMWTDEGSSCSVAASRMHLCVTAQDGSDSCCWSLIIEPGGFDLVEVIHSLLTRFKWLYTLEAISNGKAHLSL